MYQFLSFFVVTTIELKNIYLRKKKRATSSIEGLNYPYMDDTKNLI